ncbi:Bicarbonate transport system permease protein CmpB [Arthrobacter saudimassiliensis]|uniref:Bicarbonate transport system permease protein CmpB n=1 Tax=Arthrobacter saudimassiliensis TaxID=1461584 RepID=A0A078MSF7_9MICC|nr:Bicarbonate transport system permease protein CmpB [Arthrobacter saudimassiliensis]
MIRTAGYALGLPLLLILIWWAATLGSTNFFVPKPGQLASTLVDVWVGERFFQDILPSVGRLLLGVALAILLGVALGTAIGTVRWLRSLLEPLLEFFRAIPPPVLIPVLMLLIGVNDQMKVGVIVMGCIWPVLLNTIEGVRAVDGTLSDTSRTFRISGASRLRYLVLPSAGPQIMAGVRQCLSIGLILMVISEMFASSEGLGFTIVQFQRSFAIPEMWSGIVVLGLIGVAMSLVFQWSERRILAWYHGQREVEHAE